MLSYYINTKTKILNNKVSPEIRHLFFINIIIFIQTFKIKEPWKKKTICIKTNVQGIVYETQSDIKLNKFNTFLSKKIISKNSLTKGFINYFDYFGNKATHAKKKTEWNKIKKKITNNRWRFFKKKLTNIFYKTFKNKTSMLKLLKPYKNFIKRQLYQVKILKNKQNFKKYKIKKTTLKDDIKKRYKDWLDNNYKNYFYQNKSKNKFFLKKVSNIKKLIAFVILNRHKKQSNKFLKRKFNLKIFKKVRTITVNLLQEFNFKKNLIKKTTLKKNYKIIWKNKTKSNLIKNKIKISTLIEFPIILKNLNIILKNHQKKKNPPQKLQTKNQLKNLFFKTCFNTSQDNIYNINKTSNMFLSSTPQLIINTITQSKQKKHNNNTSTHTVLKTALTQHEQKTQKNTLSLFMNIMFLKTNKSNTFNNYFPLYFFKINNRSNYENSLTSLSTKLYYYNINTTSTSKYKTFFVFFVLNFLERFLSKKIWLRINANDPLPSFWKNHINVFLYNNLFLYKKFNKLIPIRELLEILWLTFQNHDLQILLIFIKRKLENSHFKKHKKILSIFFDILRKNEFIFTFLKIRGFFFDIRGKVGVSGNAKKRHHSFSIGKITTTSQNTGSYFQQISVWTPTGQMGITCILQY